MVVIRSEIAASCALYNAKGRNKFFWYPAWSDGSYYTPTFWIDGEDSLAYSASVDWWWNELRTRINARRAVPSPIELSMDVEYGARGDTGTVHVQVVATDSVPHEKLHIRTAIVEDSLFQAAKKYDQILRDHFPTYVGYLFSTISEGDTVEHSEDFVLDSTWVVEKCRVVAFVQNGKDTPLDYEVVQALQEPIPCYVPVPEKVANLTVTLVEDDLRLEWSPVEEDTSGMPITVNRYQIYRDTVDFFAPGSDPFDSTPDTLFIDGTGVVGDNGTNYYYAVTAVLGDKESEYSGLAGEFDRHAITGK